MLSDLYEATGEFLGNGSYASVQAYKNKASGKEYAVKVSCLYLLIYEILMLFVCVAVLLWPAISYVEYPVYFVIVYLWFCYLCSL